MRLTEIQTLFAYDSWATGRLLDQVERLTPEQYTSPSGPGGQSIAQVLTHTLIAQQLWRVRFETGQTAVRISPDAFPTVGAFRAGWQEGRRALDAFLATLDEQALDQPVRFERRGETYAYTLWHLLFQLINHNTQHRAELAERVTAHGYSPGDLDFFLFVSPVV